MRFTSLSLASLLTFAALGLAGCDGAEACDADGATRCFENAAETCTAGAWTLDDDCDANGQTCMQDDAMMEGEAHCM